MVIISIKLWGSKLVGTIVRIHANNEAVSCIINTDRSKDLQLQTLLFSWNFSGGWPSII